MGGENHHDEAKPSGGLTPQGHRLHKPGVAGSSPAAATTALRFDEPINAYHADKEWWSKSQLWDLWANGPLYFHGRYISGGISNPFGASLVKGTHVHEWAEQGPSAWWGRVVVIPKEVLGADGRRTKKTEEWLAGQSADAICLSVEEAEAYHRQFDAILANPIFGRLQEQTEHREFSIRWIDPETGLKLKCRPDACAATFLWDLKTTKERQPLKTFWRSVIDYGYAFQAEHYLSGARAAGIPATKFVFLLSSTVPPYECHAVVLPEQLLKSARRDLRSTRIDLKTRLLIDHWNQPDAGQITELVVPRWVLKESRNATGSRTERSE